jgi:hypothetical protein
VSVASWMTTTCPSHPWSCACSLCKFDKAQRREAMQRITATRELAEKIDWLRAAGIVARKRSGR